jgi:uncharacterized coiled-coil DUF342 family protein
VSNKSRVSRISRDQRSDIRNQRVEIRDQRSEIRDQRAEIRGQRSEIRDQRSEIRDQRSETRDQSIEIREQRDLVKRRYRRLGGTEFAYKYIRKTSQGGDCRVCIKRNKALL